jgi:hypothetical protein
MALFKAMTLQTLKESVKNAIDNIRPEHYKNYFKYAYDKENYVNKPDNPENRKRSNKYKQPKIYRL